MKIISTFTDRLKECKQCGSNKYKKVQFNETVKTGTLKHISVSHMCENDHYFCYSYFTNEEDIKISVKKSKNKMVF